eukprot:scaffold1156_cov394-Prasinococcus_capsulatus_cf.AAC.11
MPLFTPVPSAAQCTAFVGRHVSEITAALEAEKTPAEVCEGLTEPYCNLDVQGAGTGPHCIPSRRAGWHLVTTATFVTRFSRSGLLTQSSRRREVGPARRLLPAEAESANLGARHNTLITRPSYSYNDASSVHRYIPPDLHPTIQSWPACLSSCRTASSSHPAWQGGRHLVKHEDRTQTRPSNRECPTPVQRTHECARAA